MRNKLCIFALGLLLSCFSQADEIEEAIQQGVELYKSGNLKQAITQLEYASSLIREQRGNSLVNFLPAALSGWSTNEGESSSVGPALLGGGTSASRSYTKGDTTITISITTDSPILQSFMMMFSNPMVIQSQGGKLRMIQGNQVVFNDSGATSVVNNAYLVQVEKDGNMQGVIDPDVLAYTEAIDFNGIKNAN